jgi:hypothetical protein
VLATIAELEAQGAGRPEPLRDELISPERVADAVVGFVEDDSTAGRVLVLRGGNEPELLPFSL